MSRIVKIYCAKNELASIAPSAELLEPYDAFQLVSISPAGLKKASEQVPVEDISSLYQLKIAGKKVNTTRQRYSAKGKAVAHPSYKGAPKLSTGKHHYIVQFCGPVKEKWIRQAEKAGAQFRSPYADFACIFRMTPAVLAKVNAMPFVRWVGHLKYEARLAGDVLKPRRRKPKASRWNMEMGPDGVEIPGMLEIQFFDGKDLAAAKPKFRQCGAKLISSEPTGVAVVKVAESATAFKAAVRALSALHGVRLISKRVVPSTRNNVAPTFMGAARTISSGGLGLTGEGEIVAVADTGLDTGVIGTVKSDFAGRVKAIHSWSIDDSFDGLVTNGGGDDGAADVDSGHGTHVAGSVLGGGSDGPGGAHDIRGLAHEAHLVFQAVEQKLSFASAEAAEEFDNDPYQLAGLPTELSKLFQQAYDAGARIHSNSWGGGRAGDYASTSRQLDNFVWDHPDFCVLVAAGNEGVDASPSDGKVDPGSVSSPGTAKNCITVGASQSERPEFAHDTFGKFWPDDFPKQPLKNQPVAGDRDKMAAFSSRGPTLDGRVKPDVVAPGTYILSTRSTQLPDGQNGWGPYDANPGYMFEGGTSMATPLTAGAVALVRQFFRVRQNISSPSAALLKATLICGARRMPLSYVPSGALVDNHQGFGRVDLDTVLSPTDGASFGFKDVAPGLQTGDSSEFTITAVNTRKLRVVLAYSDYPGRGLKNNLNLLLTAPDGTRRLGNAQGAQLTFDLKNNVELVEVAAPAPGSWRVQVVASNVPEGPQPFALVWLV
jgi:subtilisin family serine protease